MQRIIFIFILCSTLLLNACVHYSTQEESYDLSKAELTTHIDNFYFYGIQSAEDQQIAANAIVTYLREQHPTLPSDFPMLTVKSIKMGNDVVDKIGVKKKEEIEIALTNIFTKVEQDLFPENRESEHAWPTTLIVSSYNRKLTSQDYARYKATILPAVALCWGSALIVCPDKATHIYSVEIIAYSPNGREIKAIGSGASVLFQQSQINSPHEETRKQYRKALVAATADATNKWIAAWEANK